MKKIDEFIGIRNFIVKTILAIVGLYFVLGTGHKYVADLCNELTWDNSDSIIMSAGFVLAVGAALYNKIIEAIINKFSK